MSNETKAPQPPAEAQAQGVGEALEAELIALVAGPYHYHHKMDEHAEREGKAFDRCRELTIQNIRTWCATRRAMLAAQPPSAPVGVEAAVATMDRMPDLQRLLELRQYDDTDGPMEVTVGTDLIDAVMYEVRDTICRVAAGNSIGAALAQQPAAVDGDSAEALKFLLSRIGSWTDARWDQHLRHEFGDVRAERMIAALAGQQRGEK